MKSATRSSAPTATKSDLTTVETTTVAITGVPPAPPSLLAKWLESAPTIIFAALGFLIVHRLTQWREREKSVFELYRVVGDQISAAAKAAIAAWGAKRGPKRRRAIAEAKWRIQQVGSTVARLESLSRRRRQRRWKRIPYWPRVAIVATASQISFRKALTGDENFDDDVRDADNVRAEAIERASGEYQAAIDAQLFQWI